MADPSLAPKFFPQKRNGSNAGETVEVGRGIRRNDEGGGRAHLSLLCSLSKEYVPGKEARMWRHQSTQRGRQINWLDCLSQCFLSLYRTYKSNARRRFIKAVSPLAKAFLTLPHSTTDRQTHPGWRVLRAQKAKDSVTQWNPLNASAKKNQGTWAHIHHAAQKVRTYFSIFR